MSKITYVSVLLSSILGASVVQAATAPTQTFEVKLTINESCEFNSATDIDFGTLDRSTDASKLQTGTLTATCTVGTPYRVLLDSQRKMTHANDSQTFIKYDLYQDAGTQKIWGNTNDTALVKEGTGGVDSITVFAKLDGNTNVKAGVYTDTVTAKILY